MMTSDMTPDLNGNFNHRESSRHRGDNAEEYQGMDTRKHIANRVSDTQPLQPSPVTTTQSIQSSKVDDMDMTTTEAVVDSNKEIKKIPLKKTIIKDDLMRENTADMRLSLEANRYKWLAKKQLEEEIMYSPERWHKQDQQEDPLFTTIEIYELPGANAYMGLASNRTVVHKAPEEPKPTPPAKTQTLKNNVKVSDNSRHNYYFKNVLNRREFKTRD
ncbi:unnamed protein product [Medioppia subpectinata]|uniref:Uncharacterized protein n=1 Tax=Medioppia subpectinata TaxID=1979941 RepID=A0A7R9QDG3_9ACAR|nr:unnamed protein product [Medioppia subpectinata]CAG2118371.1 unnamed protein product [Medioppia subpectinata]